MTETIQDTLTRLLAFVVQANPQADVSPGSVLNELVLKLSATLQNPQYNTIQALDQANAIQTVLDSLTPTTNYPSFIDEIASNWGATRNTGSLSTGQLQVFVSKSQGYFLNTGFTFQQASLGLQYVTTSAFTVVTGTPATSASSTQVQLLFNGTSYYFIVPVVAAAVGSSYQVPNGSQFSVVSPATIPNLVSIAAYGNFTTGAPLATDQQLVNSFKSTLSNTTLTSSNSISAFLDTQFPSFQGLSVIGANDPEMVRSKRNIIGISTFGKADVYVRTALGSETITVVKTGTKIANMTLTSPAIWQISVDTSDAPGFYRALSILPTPVGNAATTGTLVIDSTTFGYSPTVFQYNNVVSNATDARFTSYQTAAINFEYDAPTTLDVGSTATFNVMFSYQPNIADIQGIFQSNGTRIPCGDYLVKAALPCFVSVLISLVRKSPTDTATSIGIPQLQQDIFNYVNSVPFGTSLYASKIVQLCHNYPIERVELPIVLNGSIYTTQGTAIQITSNDELVIPTDLANGVSPNTTTFFIDYFQVGANGTTPISNIGIALI